ncbi:MAG: hypothetical protein AAGD25_14860 [Cyanobacteria bacterium P01_F01_bin.150]
MAYGKSDRIDSGLWLLQRSLVGLRKKRSRHQDPGVLIEFFGT